MPRASAGPQAAQRILRTAAQEFPLTKDVHLLAAQSEVAFWQALRQGRSQAARSHAATLCSLPHPTGATEMDMRHVFLSTVTYV